MKGIFHHKRDFPELLPVVFRGGEDAVPEIKEFVDDVAGSRFLYQRCELFRV
jgi:hypothetical protein